MKDDNNTKKNHEIDDRQNDNGETSSLQNTREPQNLPPKNPLRFVYQNKYGV